MRASGFAVSLALLSAVPGIAGARSAEAAPPAAADETEAAAPGGLELTSDGCSEEDEAVDGTNELIGRAGTAYDARDLPVAIALTREAHGLSGCVDLLLLLGQLNEEANDVCAARAFYERYLSERPSGSLAERASARLAALSGVCQAAPETSAAPAPERPWSSAPLPPKSKTEGSAPLRTPPGSAPPAALEPSWNAQRTLAWSAIGASALASAAALGFALRAREIEEDYEARLNNGRSDAALYRRGEAAERNAVWLSVAAGALAGTGVILLLVNRDGTASSARTALFVGVEPGGAAAEYRVRF